MSSFENPAPSNSAARRLPLYARVLRLRHLRPSGLLCFLYFEGAAALGALLALAEMVSWWAVALLPLTVAAMVKLHDILAGALPRSTPAAPSTDPEPEGLSTGSDRSRDRGEEASEDRWEAPLPPVGRQVSRDVVEALDPVDSVRQRVRQSAQWRYHYRE
ncbi:MAG TPA: hypothetical protein VKZ67_04240 [Natronosporangium sp.]|nr:hypothetical protein [Natronosporangium sp.]